MKVANSPCTSDKTICANVTTNRGTENPTKTRSAVDAAITPNDDGGKDDKKKEETSSEGKKVYFTLSSLKTDTFDAKAVTGKIAIKVHQDENDSENFVFATDQEAPSIEGFLTHKKKVFAVVGKVTPTAGDEKEAKWVLHLGIRWDSAKEKFVPSACDAKEIYGESLLSLINNKNETSELQLFSKDSGDDQKPILVLSLEPVDTPGEGEWVSTKVSKQSKEQVEDDDDASIWDDEQPISEDETKPEDGADAVKMADKSNVEQADFEEIDDTKDENPSPPKKTKVDGEESEDKTCGTSE